MLNLFPQNVTIPHLQIILMIKTNERHPPPLSSKILPTTQQDKSTGDHSPYGETFVNIKYGFPGGASVREATSCPFPNFLPRFGGVPLSLLASHGFTAGAAYVV